jgi:putative PEP-CTERM system histidine kinase
MKRKHLISKYFKRPQYDYQKIWEDFTKRTTSVTQTRELCNIIVRIVWETLETLSVSIWLVDEKKERLSFGGSTVFTVAQAEGLKFFGRGGADLIRAMIDQTMPVDLESRKDDWVEDLKHTYGMETKESRIRYCVPLNAAGNLIGIMTLSEKVFYEPLTFEEFGLIKTIADQAAAALLNLRLSEQIRHAKELEAFQSMSAFFMHDLKNLASKLSLVTQNLPLHVDNPEFRNDALHTIEQSVLKINTMSSRLSLLSQKLEISPQLTDVNDLIRETVSRTQGYINSSIVQDLQDLPLIPVDRDQFQKALENLLMNAHEATGNGGQITVITNNRDTWAEIAICDNGCGMSREFINTHLFRPFQTTKKKGMGIGLFHCKTIVEAHSGKIEVDSEEGKGTTFRVFLPVK